MIPEGNVESTRCLRAQLASDIQILVARARDGGAPVEVLGILPDRDRVAAMKQRLERVDRLLEAMKPTETGSHHGWPADLGDPTQSTIRRNRS